MLFFFYNYTMGWFNKNNKYTKRITDTLDLDQGGREYSDSIVDMIANLRTGLFKYEGWPFKLQTVAEVEMLLFQHGVIAPIKVHEDWIAVPVNLSRKINKINYSHVSVSITGEWSNDIGKVFNLNDDDVKKQMPFLFDTISQTTPIERQGVIIKQLAGTFNANVSNRINKNKQYIWEVEKGQFADKAFELNITTENYGPALVIEKGSNSKSNEIMAGDGFRPMTNGVADLYNSLSTEKKDLIKELHVYNGLRSSQTNEKSSAQETDSQTTSQDRDSVNNLLAMLRSRKDSIKNLNRFMGTKIRVRFKENIQLWVEGTLTDERENEEND